VVPSPSRYLLGCAWTPNLRIHAVSEGVTLDADFAPSALEAGIEHEVSCS
jgi:hypothetical protein